MSVLSSSFVNVFSREKGERKGRRREGREGRGEEWRRERRSGRGRKEKEQRRKAVNEDRKVKQEKKKEGRKENSVIINLVPSSKNVKAPNESLLDFIILVKKWIYPRCSLDFMD